MLNETVFEWDGAIFLCTNQVNSDSAVAVGQNTYEGRSFCPTCKLYFITCNLKKLGRRRRRIILQ